jgi:hypothetical protein
LKWRAFDFYSTFMPYESCTWGDCWSISELFTIPHQLRLFGTTSQCILHSTLAWNQSQVRVRSSSLLSTPLLSFPIFLSFPCHCRRCSHWLLCSNFFLIEIRPKCCCHICADFPTACRAPASFPTCHCCAALTSNLLSNTCTWSCPAPRACHAQSRELSNTGGAHPGTWKPICGVTALHRDRPGLWSCCIALRCTVHIQIFFYVMSLVFRVIFFKKSWDPFFHVSIQVHIYFYHQDHGIYFHRQNHASSHIYPYIQVSKLLILFYSVS